MTGDDLDPFHVLSIPPGSPWSDVRRAYVRLLRQHPPEKDPSGFQRIRRAYELLQSLQSTPFADWPSPEVEPVSRTTPESPIGRDPSDLPTADDIIQTLSSTADATQAVAAVHARWGPIASSHPSYLGGVLLEAGYRLLPKHIEKVERILVLAEELCGDDLSDERLDDLHRRALIARTGPRSSLPARMSTFLITASRNPSEARAQGSAAFSSDLWGQFPGEAWGALTAHPPAFRAWIEVIEGQAHLIWDRPLPDNTRGAFRRAFLLPQACRGLVSVPIMGLWLAIMVGQQRWIALLPLLAGGIGFRKFHSKPPGPRSLRWLLQRLSKTLGVTLEEARAIAYLQARPTASRTFQRWWVLLLQDVQGWFPRRLP